MRLAIALFFIISSCFSSGLRAQEGEGYDEETAYETEFAATPTNEKLAKIAARLQLTDDQLPQVEAILEEFSLQPVPTTPEAKKARRRALRARVSALLTPEQRVLIQQSRNNAPGKAAGKASRNWLDVLVDDIAAPLINQRGQKRRPNQ